MSALEVSVAWQSWLGFIAVSILLLFSVVVWAAVVFQALPARLASAANATAVLGFAWCLYWNRKKGKGFSQGLAIDIFATRFRNLEKAEPKIAEGFLVEALLGHECRWSYGEVTLEQLREAAARGLKEAACSAS